MKLFAVYLCGDIGPSALFIDKKDAENWPVEQPHWMDKEIKEVDSKKQFLRGRNWKKNLKL